MPEGSLTFKLIGYAPVIVNSNCRQGPVTSLYEIISAPDEFKGYRTFEHIPVGLGSVRGLKTMLEALTGEGISLVATHESFGLMHITDMKETNPLRIKLTNDPV